MEIGENIRHHRVKLGLTQQEVAEKLHITANALGHYERGIRVPSIYLLFDLATLFSISLDELINFENNSISCEVSPLYPKDFAYLLLHLNEFRLRRELQSFSNDVEITNHTKRNNFGPESTCIQKYMKVGLKDDFYYLFSVGISYFPVPSDGLIAFIELSTFKDDTWCGCYDSLFMPDFMNEAEAIVSISESIEQELNEKIEKDDIGDKIRVVNFAKKLVSKIKNQTPEEVEKSRKEYERIHRPRKPKK